MAGPALLEPAYSWVLRSMCIKKHTFVFLVACLLSAVLLPQNSLSDETKLNIIPLKHLTVEQAIPLIKPFIGEQGAISGMNNQLILRVTPANLEQIKNLLDTLDVAPRRLLITVKQDVYTDEAERNAELSGQVRSGDARATLGRPGANDLELRINRSDSQEDDLHTQQVQVIEGYEAFIQIGESVPLSESQLVLGGADPRIVNSIRYQDVTTGFMVLPRVNGAVVTLEINPQRAVLDKQGTGNIDVQRIHTTVSGRLGEWIDIGGNLQNQSEASDGILSSTRQQREQQRRVLLKVEEAG